MDNWLRLLKAAASEDRHACLEWSLKLGYLTGNEKDVCSAFFLFRQLTDLRLPGYG
jgi:hypothetical protein